MKKVAENIFLAVLSGGLGSLAFPPFEFSFLGWVCLVPIFFIAKRNRPFSAFGYSYLAGVIFFGCVLYWLVNVSRPGMIALVLILALFYGIFGLFSWHVLKKSMDLLILPFGWVALEYLRSHLFTGFPWALLGYSQYKDIYLIQVADITGAYGVSFLIVAVNAAMFGLCIRSARRKAYLAVALVFLIMTTVYGVYRVNERHVRGSARISVVQGNIPQQHKWDMVFAEEIVEKYEAMTRLAVENDPDMIIWPETAYPYLVKNDDPAACDIAELAFETDTPIMAGVVYGDDGTYYNGAVLFSRKGDLESVYRKTHLVPFGEYVPFEKKLAFLRKYIDKPIGDFESGNEYTLFPLKVLRSAVTEDGAKTRQIDFYKFGVLICFEDVFPYVAREFTRAGADFLVNITNDAWFGETAAAKQHLMASVFRAVENKVPVIRAANTGISCFVEPTGRILPGVRSGEKDIFVEGFATEDVRMYAGRTCYTQNGDIFVWFCVFMLGLLLAVEKMLRRSRPVSAQLASGSE
ncbi:MAG: apolipoprotein N-acyltransferase [Candidatus Omnitrophota bacterium]